MMPMCDLIPPKFKINNIKKYIYKNDDESIIQVDSNSIAAAQTFRSSTYLIRKRKVERFFLLPSLPFKEFFFLSVFFSFVVV